MGTLVLLTAFLLAASANPIVNSPEDTVEEASLKDPENVLSTDNDAELPSGDNTANNINEAYPSIDEVPDSTVSNGDTDNREADNGGAHYGDVHNGDADNGHLNSGDVYNGDARNRNAHTDDVYNQNSGNTDAQNEEVLTSAVGTASTTPTTTSVSNSEIELHKGDDTDCNYTNTANHTFLKCQFLCETDEMELAPANASCYLNQTKTTFSSLGVRSRMEAMQTGICQDGECIPQPPETSTSISTIEPSSSFSAAETSTSPSATQTSTSTSTTTATANNSQDINTSEPITMD